MDIVESVIVEPIIVVPIDEQQQQHVCRVTEEYLQQASEIYAFDVRPVPVLFDLKGRAAGMYVVQNRHRCIRYNPWLFARYFEESLVSTVPHEVAHCVCDILYGLANIKPHGVEWQQVMRSLGAEPRATGRYDLAGIPVRRQQRFAYQCDCMLHQLSASRHYRIQRGNTVYSCRGCGQPLSIMSDVTE
jgi:SprT protein